MKPATEFVLYALSIGALALTPTELKSKRISPYFFNSGLFNSGEESIHLARAYAAAALVDLGQEVDVVFGPAYKGIPLAVTTSMAIFQRYGINVGWAFNRKEVKDHGEGGNVVGYPMKRKRVLIVDDVMTTGASSGEAVDIVLANGGIPIGEVIAFDRQERGKDTTLSAVQEFEKKYNVPVCAAATLTDLISVLKEKAPKSESLSEILKYQEKYGV